MLHPIGPDDLMSLRAAATIGDAAFDLALLRVGILAPAELDEIRSLVLHPTACLEPTRLKRSKIRSRISGGIPGPLSRTQNLARWSSILEPSAISSSESVQSTAFWSNWIKACASRCRSRPSSALIPVPSSAR